MWSKGGSQNAMLRLMFWLKSDERMIEFLLFACLRSVFCPASM